MSDTEDLQRRLKELSDYERARSIYYLRYNRGPWVRVSEEEFIAAERAAGFFPKFGCGPIATAGFSASSGDDEVEGCIDYRKVDADGN